MSFIRMMAGICMLALCGFASIASAILVNGDFGQALDPNANWTAVNAVTQGNDSVTLGDGDAGQGSRLFQVAAFGPGSYRIEFDLLAGQSSTVDQGFFPDAFFASLYFIDDPNAFDVDQLGFDDSLELFGVDLAGFYDVQGAFSDSPLGNDWLHFSFVFQNQRQHIIPFFELIDLNAVGSDSRLLLDNVTIEEVQAIIPEPTTLSLAVTGLTLLAWRRRRASGSVS